MADTVWYFFGYETITAVILSFSWLEFIGVCALGLTEGEWGESDNMNMKRRTIFRIIFFKTLHTSVLDWT